LIFTDASHGGSGHHQIPGCLEDPRGAELLPEGDIEFPAGRSPAHQAAHRYSFRHTDRLSHRSTYRESDRRASLAVTS
jgi:hypothetical protein